MINTRINLDLIFVSESGDETNHTTISFKDAMGTRYSWRTYTPENAKKLPKFFEECVCKAGHICKVRATVLRVDSQGRIILTRVSPRK